VPLPAGVPAVRLPSGLVAVEVVQRLNRFAVVAVAAAGGPPLRLHLPNSGRMEELLQPGTTGLARLQTTPGRRTAGTLLLVRRGRRWIGMDAQLPNRLVRAALTAGALPPWVGVTDWRAEVPLGDERLDFLIRTAVGVCWLEVKSCNRVERGTALFPDAATSRGRRHLQALAASLGPDRRAAMLWIVQREDAERLRPLRAVDPAFADALREAAGRGVELYAYRCRVSPREVALERPIPVELA
jgi:sugar fermentation stimulation protein A